MSLWKANQRFHTYPPKPIHPRPNLRWNPRCSTGGLAKSTHLKATTPYHRQPRENTKPDRPTSYKMGQNRIKTDRSGRITLKQKVLSPFHTSAKATTQVHDWRRHCLTAKPTIPENTTTSHQPALNPTSRHNNRWNNTTIWLINTIDHCSNWKSDTTSSCCNTWITTTTRNHHQITSEETTACTT